ncbi:CHASE3 domain-containing protein [Iningainema sp. BLCCT55]|uniref:histidine kinase n=2 Tax=Iningainema TaxID=1932705 RepID=A0A8J6XLY0_9CYAN|nr:ATP-binding protein [Iningainema tapete]MBD2773346.1 CHASE3 domain-containing protein [Iningainema tapete BLCC-T55]
MKWSFEKKWIAGGFGLAVAVMAIISGISYQNATSLKKSTQKVKQSHEVLETLIGVTATLNDADSGRRGYILLGDKSELKRYNQAIQAIAPQLNKLRRLLDKNSKEHHQHLAKLESLLAQRLVLSQQSINLYQKGTYSPSNQTTLAVESKRNWAELQQIIDQMRLEEEQALFVWVKQSQSSIQSRMLIEILGTFFTFAILFEVYAQLYRQMIKRQQAETLQSKLAQEKELGELKLQFFSMVSHEFRTPLSVILGSAQLLEESLQSLVEKQKLKNLYRIQSSARLMTQLLSDILTLARAEAGKLEYKPEFVEMQTFCLNLIEDIQTMSNSQHFISFDKQGSCTHAWVDEKLLYSILSNLLSNAIKYSPQSKDICFTFKCEPEAITFQVKDFGIGIPKEIQQELYEPFKRGNNVKGILGTGLGLAVVKKCLDLHRGEISVESDVGVGTHFTVKIPQNQIKV